MDSNEKMKWLEFGLVNHLPYFIVGYLSSLIQARMKVVTVNIGGTPSDLYTHG